jgi:hypothetical protein
MVAQHAVAHADIAALHAQFRSDIDTTALQHLLSAVPPSVRDVVRSTFEVTPGVMRDLSVEGNPTLAGLVADIYEGNNKRWGGETSPTASPPGREQLKLWTYPVVLAVTSDPRLAGDRAVVVYRSPRWGFDVLVLGERAANVDALDAGLRAVYALRLRQGLHPQSDRVLRLEPRADVSLAGGATGRQRPRSWGRFLERQLLALQRAPTRAVPALGRFQAIECRVVSP